jgi:hypothetical protein
MHQSKQASNWVSYNIDELIFVEELRAMMIMMKVVVMIMIESQY